ncbi:cobalt ECF transporter T component CbiQ [Streptomyces sp. NPDC059816]|uniref:cobalt ECF transporter T component CbiQ n=1 Tax=Streptomyces sp. NPDC059816 TaxID=3346960 RepID=UPI003664DA8B
MGTGTGAGAGHVRGLYLPGTSPVHALPAHTKIASLLCFVLVVVSTPRTAVWAFLGYAVLLAAVARLARVPTGTLLRRLLIEVPFLGFALLLPFVAEGDRVTVLGLALSADGLWGAWNVLAKGTLGVAASVLLAATTPLRELLSGLERLRLPGPLVQIATFMVRYVDVIADELRRMRIAQLSRGFEGNRLRHWGVLAHTAGSLFIRAYERGERVHLAMLSRGYTGALPAAREVAAVHRDRGRGARARRGRVCGVRGRGDWVLGDWVRALALPAAAVVLGLLARVR